MRKYGVVKLEKDNWVILGEPHVILKMKRVFGKADNSVPGKLFISNTPENCRDLVWFLTRYTLAVHPKHIKALEDGAKAFDERILTLEKILSGKYSAKKLQLAIPARDYQVVAAQLYLKNGFLLLGDDVGVGKTLVPICAMMEPETRPALVVTLTHLTRQWRDELKKFAPQLRTYIAKTGKPCEIKDKKTGLLPDVIIMNYHKLHGWAQTLAKYIKSVTFDEGQELRHSGSQKYWGAQTVAAAAKYRISCTATPIYNYGSEMYNVVRVLSPDALGSQDEFLREWCSGDCVRDPKAFGSYLRENFIMLRRTRQDVGREIPPVNTIPHAIDSNTEALSSIKGNAAELAKIILSSSPVARGDAFNASGKFDVLLRQATGIAKGPFVADFVRILVESGESVLLYGWHHSVYDIWKEKLADLNPVLYTGEETPNQKDESKRKFVSGESKIMIISLRAGAGLDGLQHACRTVVYGEMDYSFAVHEQGTGRVARDGQKDPVTAYFLISEEGSDPIMADILGVKRQQLEGIRDPNKDYIEKLQRDDDHIKRLARHYLEQIGQAPEIVAPKLQWAEEDF